LETRLTEEDLKLWLSLDADTLDGGRRPEPTTHTVEILESVISMAVVALIPLPELEMAEDEDELGGILNATLFNGATTKDFFLDFSVEVEAAAADTILNDFLGLLFCESFSSSAVASFLKEVALM
jgi:hypothetical protein